MMMIGDISLSKRRLNILDAIYFQSKGVFFFKLEHKLCARNDNPIARNLTLGKNLLACASVLIHSEYCVLE